MPKGSKGERHPVDAIGNAVKVMPIAVGDDSGTVPDDGKNKAAQEPGRMARAARPDSIGIKRWKEIAKLAGKARWEG